MGGLYDNNRQRFKKNTVQSKCVCVCVCVCGALKRRIGHVKWWSEGIRERSLWRSRRLLSAPNRLCIFSQSHVCNMQTTHTHTHTHTHTLSDPPGSNTRNTAGTRSCPAVGHGGGSDLCFLWIPEEKPLILGQVWANISGRHAPHTASIKTAEREGERGGSDWVALSISS